MADGRGTGEVANLDDDGSGEASHSAEGQSDATITVDVAPAFTPDGGTVSFSRSTFRDWSPGRKRHANVPVDGGEPSQLLEGATRSASSTSGCAGRSTGRPSTTPSATDPGHPHGIWAMAADGSGRIPLRHGRCRARLSGVAQVASNGSACSLYPLAASRYAGPDGLALIATTTGAPMLLTVEIPGPARGAIQMATFSPDATALLEVTSRTQPDHQVRIRDLATGTLTPLIDKGLESAGPME